VAEGFLSVRVEVAWGDCDPAGIVFYPRFFAWMDRVSHVLARELGVTREAMLPPGEMLGFPIVAAQAEFLSPARMDDQLEVRTWVQRVGRSSLSLRHEVVRIDRTAPEGQLLARGREDRVFIGRDAQGQMQSRELTPAMRATLARYADPQVQG